jgi:hypothetical protein
MQSATATKSLSLSELGENRKIVQLSTSYPKVGDVILPKERLD